MVQIQEYLNKDLQEEQFKQKELRISVVIPLYNEEKSIVNMINRIPDHQQYEIVVVDDGSTDNSVEKVWNIQNREIILIQHEKNYGYGAAILTGFKHATGDIIVTMDSDGQHDPEDIPNLIKPIIDKKVDFSVGSRYLGKCKYKVPLHTRFGELFIMKCLSILYSQKVQNNQSGFRAFRNESLKFFNNMIFSKFGICTEFLFRAACNDLKIAEVPINLNSRQYGTSYVRLMKVMTSILSCVLIYLLKEFRIKKLLPKSINRISYYLLKEFFKKY